MIGMMRMTIGMMGMEKDNKNNKDNKDNKKDRGKDQVIGSGTLLTKSGHAEITKGRDESMGSFHRGV